MINELMDSLNLIISQTQNNLKILGIILLIPWSVFFVSHFISNRILLLGIIPRQIRGLPGILFAPLLHANFNHIFFNSIPLLVLSNFILINGLNYYLAVTLIITLLSGLAIWCFAKPGLHIGASALITGYWGFLICNIYQNGTVTTIILGIISLYYFAGIFLGIFPGEKGVSWQGHLFGLLAGIATSYLFEMYSLQNFM
ncbi:rhomboid family intramembrane serine protease [Legionella shakespearei]|uniref:Putative rhomboid family protein n=1 Tax=Legionella shakespearei DSM 23087 TaxID=1122169 RepID=A0A0W0YVP7_9GAMM|nr:rhomboid family intramembrane serine protease [Legionella shakespearei]KTD60783.1 putative rhomboid family protein [Legionella shakespearei DSM 23087]